MLSALTAIAVFPVLTLLLFGLARVEISLAKAASKLQHRAPAEPATAEFDQPVVETPSE